MGISSLLERVQSLGIEDVPGTAAPGTPVWESIPVETAGEKIVYPNASNYRDFRYHALIIGFDANGSTGNEPFASQLSAFLEKWRCFSKGSITLLKGFEATKQRIKDTITNLRLDSKDVIVVYYQGHGGREGVVSSDQQYLSPDELSGYMQQSGAGFKVLLVSACYSGIFVRPDENGYNFQRDGFAVATSGEEGPTSTYEGIGFGPYLLQVLNMKQQDSEGILTLEEFVNFIKHKNAFWSQHGNFHLSDGRNSGPKDSVLFWK